MADAQQTPSGITDTTVAACPDGRISVPTRVVDGDVVLDLENYIPHLLSSVNNALSRGASQRYLADFGIGIVEWRVLSMLAIEPGIQAARICDVIKIDKGAASRALSGLASKELLTYEVQPNDPRKRVWWLNPAGKALHDQIMQVALRRECTLIAGVDADDLEVFLHVLRAMYGNLNSLK